jgi:hypothetical protein
VRASGSSSTTTERIFLGGSIEAGCSAERTNHPSLI